MIPAGLKNMDTISHNSDSFSFNNDIVCELVIPVTVEFKTTRFGTIAKTHTQTSQINSESSSLFLGLLLTFWCSMSKVKLNFTFAVN